MKAELRRFTVAEILKGFVYNELEGDGLIIASRRDDGTLAASTVDPHGDHLADAKSKLRALADYADKYSDSFVRVESVAKVGDTLRTLDLTNPSARAAIADFEDGKVTALYESNIASDYALGGLQ